MRGCGDHKLWVHPQIIEAEFCYLFHHALSTLRNVTGFVWPAITVLCCCVPVQREDVVTTNGVIILRLLRQNSVICILHVSLSTLRNVTSCILLCFVCFLVIIIVIYVMMLNT